MVVAEETETKQWKAVFDQGLVLPPSRSTCRRARENHERLSRGFELRLSRATAPHVPQDCPNMLYQLRASLFDGRQQQFMGQTWSSPPQMLSNSKISFNQVLYFHTVLRVPRVLLVVELVELTSARQVKGRGFTLLELFSNEAVPATSERNHVLNLHHGSPRSLLHPALKDTTDYNSVLRPVEGAHLKCTLKELSSLTSAMHLFPENVLLSIDTSIPGLLDTTGGPLLKLRLQPSVVLTLSSLATYLRPSLETFETQLLHHVNADYSRMKQSGAEDVFQPVVVQERRLHVGVHNGWGFLEPPQVVLLEVLPPAACKDNASPTQTLGLRSSLQLTLIHHPAVSIVFQLEYVFSAPIGPDAMLSASATNRVAFLQSLRWAVWSPYCPSSGLREGEARLVLQGGAIPNPHRVLVYQSEQVSGEKDIICFHLSSGLENIRKTSDSRLSVGTEETMDHIRRTPTSPAQGARQVPLPDSPQGPWASSSIAHLEAPGSLPAPSEGPLREQAFTPALAPVRGLLGNTAGSSISSRSSLAQLRSVGFPEILDCTGQLAEELDPFQPMTFDPQREENDLLQGNILLLQFLAYTRVPEERGGPDWPRSIYFTFQLYRYPPTTSQPVILLTEQSQSSAQSLCLLATINRDSTPSSASPGLQLQFRVDQSFLLPGEQRWFLQYLALHRLHIHIWDTDSLLLLGSTTLPLKHMLRQGKPAVQTLHELDILTTDEPLGVSADQGLTPGVSADQGLTPGVSADQGLTAHTVLKGRLYMRTANIGCESHHPQKKALDTAVTHIIRPQEVSRSFRGGSLSPRNLQLNARNSAQAQRLHSNRPISTDFSNRPISTDFSNRPISTDFSSAERTRDERRKLSCMAAVHQREGTHTLLPQSTDSAQVSSPDVEQSKADSISHMLCQAITQQHVLFVSLGSAEYLEYVLRNPFNRPHTVRVCSDHPDLSVITSAAEWRHFKSRTPSATAVEENMFHLDPGGPRVYLRPKETLHIPLKYQSFQSDHSTGLQGPLRAAGTSPGTACRNTPHMAAPSTIKVTFSLEDGKPLSILQVNVQPIPHMVHQTFRLYHPENSFLKKALRLPQWDQSIGAELGDQVTVRCTDPDIVCQTRNMREGEPPDVYLKVPGSPSPHVRVFSIMVYTDQWMAAPAQVWQVYVHFMERVDLSAVSGQRSCQPLVLRGKLRLRKLRCYCSHPQDLQVEPGGVFVLPPAAVQELQVKVQPWTAGRRVFLLNAVDVEQQRLVSSWLLCLTVHQPVIAKAFEVSVPVGEGRGGSRKISYTNLYNEPRSLLLRSNHPHLLQFREEHFQVGAGETYTIGLRFAPSTCPGTVNILVYVNTPEESTEEAFSVTVTYS